MFGSHVWLALILCSFGAQAREVTDYDYPDRSADESTVVGTPPSLMSELAYPGDIRENIYYLDMHKPGLERFKEQKRRGVDRLGFSLVRQKKPAPLIISIAGTGGDYASGKAAVLKRIFFRAGYHVLTLSSPTNPDFLFAASSYNHAGISPKDAEDLYAVMQTALAKVGKNIDVTEYFLTGYSLGGLNAAFVSQLDDEEQKISFSKVLLINPPVNLVTSVTNLTDIATSDELLKETGSRELSGLFNPIIQRMAEYFKRTGRIDLTGAALYQVAEGLQLSDFELRALIRVAFTFSTADMAFVTDALNQYGYIVSAQQQQVSVSRSNKDIWFKRAFAWTFIDYFRLMLMPYWQSLHPGATEEEANFAWSLLGIRDYLAGADKIQVQHNDDDIILGPGDMDFIRETFGTQRTLIYPAGGHLGNMAHKRNVDDMLAFFRE